jgi:hypothetical protein
MAGIGLALVLVAVPTVAIAQGSDPIPAGAAECAHQAEHGVMPHHMGATDGMHGSGMGSMRGAGMAHHADLDGSMMGAGG